MFEAVGILEVHTSGKDEDAFTEACLVDGVEDVEYDAGVSTVYTATTMLASVRDALTAQGIRIADCYLGARPTTKVALDGEALRAALAFLEAVDDHEDVQRLFSNLDLADVSLETLA
jgi:transcriptional/translational regulatory protein YebC/TACO1